MAFRISLHPEVLRDVKGFVPTQLGPDELGDLSEEDAAELQQDRERLRSSIRRYLGREEGAAPAGQKVYRLATHRFLQGIDHCLKLVTGHGLERLATAATVVEGPLDQQEELTTWAAKPLRALVIAAD